MLGNLSGLLKLLGALKVAEGSNLASSNHEMDEVPLTAGVKPYYDVCESLISGHIERFQHMCTKSIAWPLTRIFLT